MSNSRKNMVSPKRRGRPSSKTVSAVKPNVIANSAGRPSKYKKLASTLLENNGIVVNKSSTSRVDKVADFLKRNLKNISNVVITTNKNTAINSKKYELVGKTNARRAGEEGYSVYVMIA